MPGKALAFFTWRSADPPSRRSTRTPRALERGGERAVLEQRDGAAPVVRLGDVEQRMLRAAHHRGVVDEEDRRVAHRRAAS